MVTYSGRGELCDIYLFQLRIIFNELDFVARSRVLDPTDIQRGSVVPQELRDIQLRCRALAAELSVTFEQKLKASEDPEISTRWQLL